MKMLIVDFGLETTYNQWNSVLPKTDKICKTSYDGYLFAPGWAWKRNSGNKKYNMDVEWNKIFRIGDLFKRLLENLVKIRWNNESEDFRQIRSQLKLLKKQKFTLSLSIWKK